MGRSRDLADGTLSELNVDSNTLAVDATNNRVGIGTASPSSTLHVSGGAGSTIRNTASSGSSWIVGTNVDSYILHNESNTPMVFTTNGTERMRVDSSGRVTMPYQPSIHLDGNSGSRYTTGGVNITQFSTNHSYGGMSYNSSNGRVTVPVAGRYLVCWNFYTYFDNVGEVRIGLQVNGTGRMHSHKETASNHSPYGGLWDDNLSGSTVINLAANDAIGFYVVALGGGGGYYMGSQHSYWSAHLLG